MSGQLLRRVLASIATTLTILLSSWLVGAGIIALLGRNVQEESSGFWLLAPLVLGGPIVLFVIAAAAVAIFWHRPSSRTEILPLLPPSQL